MVNTGTPRRSVRVLFREEVDGYLLHLDWCLRFEARAQHGLEI